jgi:membrane protein implicated in regulation of membrane protease activity
MLFKVLKLFGFDVRAEVEAVKNRINQRVEDIAEHAKHVALSTALIIALLTFAGLFLTMAIGVGLIALYQTEAATYGVNLALGVVATVLVVATLILIIAAWLLGRSLSRKRSPELRDRAPQLRDDVTTPAVVPAAPLVGVPVPAAFESEPVDSTGDFMEPLAFLLAKYVKFPALGHPVLDEVIGNLRVTSRGTAEEAVERAANLVRYGDRGQLYILLGGAVVTGWLLARQSPDDRMPAG